ncbi:uncharacterized protein AMSG_05156 [Thecamonas trahens ATCC 50062]|uniref:USP domain-containing protein n=1 Tax=Thecamonas trahens ATCC 50062 TaxID=461836 RepID=A0A0L0DAR7_THETB|nr:hypothetical protein AMSG_05156 [Thecamonas trahens ATCC 50062]KNC49176.1 hypothetical protein AMSG_05156 [Thecamonas trahens ATCC 50062]|eukprot:XP_013758196.1 hypothetical protein AMSG_05156 [Thecamonas trahens ATCC 50062]
MGNRLGRKEDGDGDWGRYASSPYAPPPAGATLAADRPPPSRLGKGLLNESENNCFANVIIQSLFHMRIFREAVIAAPDDAHGHSFAPQIGTCLSDSDDDADGNDGNDSNANVRRSPSASPTPPAEPEVCLLCALQEMFGAYETMAIAGSLDPVAVRLALAQIGAPSARFGMLDMADATEALDSILGWMHEACVSSADAVCLPPCIAHEVFGMELCERVECGCGATSEPLPYSAFAHRVFVPELLAADPELALDARLAHAYDEQGSARRCPGAVPCARAPVLQLFLQREPKVFSLVLDWHPEPSKNDISRALDSIDEKLNLRNVFYGVPRSSRYELGGMICFYGRHYVCFHKSSDSAEPQAWMYFDDERVRKVGDSWADVVAMCKSGRLQPTVVFYETPHPVPRSLLPTDTSDALLREFVAADCAADFSLDELRKLQQYEMAQYASSRKPRLPPSHLAPTGEPTTVERDFVFGPRDFAQLPAQRCFDACGDRWAVGVVEDQSVAPGYLGLTLARLTQGPASSPWVNVDAHLRLVLHPFELGSSATDLIMAPGTQWRDPWFCCPRRRAEYVSNSRLSLTVALSKLGLAMRSRSSNPNGASGMSRTGRPSRPASRPPLAMSTSSSRSSASRPPSRPPRFQFEAIVPSSHMGVARDSELTSFGMLDFLKTTPGSCGSSPSNSVASTPRTPAASTPRAMEVQANVTPRTPNEPVPMRSASSGPPSSPQGGSRARPLSTARMRRSRSRSSISPVTAGDETSMQPTQIFQISYSNGSGSGRAAAATAAGEDATSLALRHPCGLSVLLPHEIDGEAVAPQVVRSATMPTTTPLFSPSSRFAPYSRGGRRRAKERKRQNKVAAMAAEASSASSAAAAAAAAAAPRSNTTEFASKFTRPVSSLGLPYADGAGESGDPVSRSARATPTCGMRDEFSLLRLGSRSISDLGSGSTLSEELVASMPSFDAVSLETPRVTMSMFEEDEAELLQQLAAPSDRSAETAVAAPVMPRDWSIKSSLRFTSTSSFDWAEPLSADALAAGTIGFARSELPAVTPGEEPAAGVEANLAAALLYWRYPESDVPSDLVTLGTFASDKAPALRSGDEKALADFFALRREAWRSALLSLYALFKRGAVPYFYFETAERTILFRPGGAVVSSSTTGFRALLTQADVPFHSPLPVAAGAESVHPLVEDETPTSALVVESKAGVHALFNFLLNYKRRRRPLTVPVLLAPGPFLNASMKSLHVANNGVIKRAKAHESGVEALYCLDIGGPILPTALTAILHLFAHTQGADYEAALRTAPNTLAMNGGLAPGNGDGDSHADGSGPTLRSTVARHVFFETGSGFHVQCSPYG